MKVLHILYSGLGGHGNVFFSLTDADTKNLFRTEALFNGVENMREDYIIRCKEKNINFNYVKKIPGFDANYYKQIARIVKISNPDIIFLHSSSYILPIALAKVFYKIKGKIIVRETQANKLKTKKEWLWLSIALLLADKCVFLSDNYKQEIKRLLPFFYKEKKAIVIPNGINLKKFTPQKYVEHTTINIGMQSRIIDIKDHLTLIKAFELLLKDDDLKDKNIILKIVGDGEYLPILKQLVNELNISKQVLFPGLMNENELVTFLNELDIYVHASLGETMSTSIMQAMACKKAIIASDVPGINNMITNNVNGLLSEVKNKNDLYNKMKLLIISPALKNLLAENATVHASKNFSNEVMFLKYQLLFNSFKN